MMSINANSVAQQRGALKANTAHIWERNASLSARIYGNSELNAMKQRHDDYAQKQRQLEQEYLQKNEKKRDAIIREIEDEEFAFSQHMTMYLAMEEKSEQTQQELAIQKKQHLIEILKMKSELMQKLIDEKEKEIQRVEEVLKNYRCSLYCEAEALLFEDYDY